MGRCEHLQEHLLIALHRVAALAAIVLVELQIHEVGDPPLFTTRREREIFMAACGSEPNTRYIDGSRVFSRPGIDPTDAAWAKEFDQVAQA